MELANLVLIQALSPAPGAAMEFLGSAPESIEDILDLTLCHTFALVRDFQSE